MEESKSILHPMAAASRVAGSAVVAVSAPRCVEEADDDRLVDLCLAEVKGTAVPTLKMRVDGRNEVFQQWELPEDEPQEEEESSASSLLERLQQRRINQELPIYYRGPPSFDLDEESPLQAGRHTAAPTADLDWSANILSIKVLHSTVGYPINLYGCVYARDDLDRKRVYLFRRDRDSAQLVESQEQTLVLTGPSRGLYFCDNLFFVFDLKVRCDQPVDDMDFSKGALQHRFPSTKSMLLMNKVISNRSTIGIAFAPVANCVEATVEIKVPQGIPMESCGKISAFISGMMADEILLFDSEACHNRIKIGDDGIIQLWRCVVAVPVHRSLVLRVDTWEPGDDSKTKRRSSSTIFAPQICGKDVARIHGSMRIKVTWSPMFISKYDAKMGFAVLLGV